MPHKKLLFIASAPVVPTDGATISMLERFYLLSRDFGWKCEVLCCARSEHKEGLASVIRNLGYQPIIERERLNYQILGSTVSMILGEGLDRFNPEKHQEIKRAFSEEISKSSASILVANLRDEIALSYLTALNDRPYVIFLTEDEYPRPLDVSDPANQDVYKNIPNLFVASEFLRSSYQASWGVAAQVFTNTINLERFSTEPSDQNPFITMLHPMSHKGISIFIELVQKLPEREFLIVGGVGAEYREHKKILDSFPNLVRRPYTSDILSIYRLSRLVLVPSLWKEAFSRVVVEALACGVPVIASDCGGIREAGEDAAVYVPINQAVRGAPIPPQNVQPWIEAIIKFDDPTYYAQTCQRAAARISRFAAALNESMKLMDKALLKISEGA